MAVRQPHLCSILGAPGGQRPFWQRTHTHQGRVELRLEGDIGVQRLWILNVLGVRGEISSDLYRFVQCDIKKCAFDSLKLEQNH